MRSEGVWYKGKEEGEKVHSFFDNVTSHLISLVSIRVEPEPGGGHAIFGTSLVSIFGSLFGYAVKLGPRTFFSESISDQRFRDPPLAR